MKLNSEDIKTIASIFQSVVIILSIIIGGVFAIYQYLELKKEKKADQSLSMIADFNKAENISHRLNLIEAWDKHQKHLQDSMSVVGPGKGSILIYMDYINNMISSEKLVASISYMISYYSGVAKCVNFKLCNKSIIDDRLYREGNIFFNNFYPYICKQREIWNDELYAIDLQNYFNKSKSKICI